MCCEELIDFHKLHFQLWSTENMLEKIVIVSAIYILYYLGFAVKKPEVCCKDGKLRQLLLTHCPMLTSYYWPTVYCFESRLQTIFRSLFKRRLKINVTSERVTFADGGQVLLDWACDAGSSEDPTAPVILMLPGLTGCSEETYIQHFIKHGQKLGCKCVVFNYRGMKSDLLTPKTYSAAYTDDVKDVVKHIKLKYPHAKLFATGHSMGGMVLFNYLGECGSAPQPSPCPIDGALIVCVPWDVFESTKSLEEPLNFFLFNRLLTYNLRRNIRKYYHLYQDHDLVDIDHVLESRTIRDFDERFTARVFGYGSVDDYYSHASLSYKIHHIKVPLVCVNASDDCFSPYHAIPTKEVEDVDNVALVITRRGGHLGFLEGMLPTGSGFSDRLFEQYFHMLMRRPSKDD